MGNAKSKLSPEQLSDLQKSTYCKYNLIASIHVLNNI